MYSPSLSKEEMPKSNCNKTCWMGETVMAIFEKYNLLKDFSQIQSHRHTDNSFYDLSHGSKAKTEHKNTLV